MGTTYIANQSSSSLEKKSHRILINPSVAWLFFSFLSLWLLSVPTDYTQRTNLKLSQNEF
jgi:hypothetical protein